MSTIMSPLPRGALIVIEGLDRAGKSTQCEKLCRFLEKEGRRVKHMRFPSMYVNFLTRYIRCHEAEILDRSINPNRQVN